jgi:hypothetical protein
MASLLLIFGLNPNPLGRRERSVDDTASLADIEARLSELAPMAAIRHLS